MEQRDAAEIFIGSYIKLLRAHGEAYPGATKDATELEAAWAAEQAKRDAATPSGPTTESPDPLVQAPTDA